MANTNYLDSNPVYTDAPQSETHVQQDSRPRVKGWHADRFHKAQDAADALTDLDRTADRDRPIESVPFADFPQEWAADPNTERDYVRFVISCIGLAGELPLILDFLAACGVANVDTGHTVYSGAVEERVTVTLFEVSLRTAFGYFAELRTDLRANLLPLDCGRFYLDNGDGSEISLCAKRVAPYWYTLAAGLPLEQTPTEGTAYAYSSGPSSPSDSRAN